jgi:hypothetical protein
VKLALGQDDSPGERVEVKADQLRDLLVGLGHPAGGDRRPVLALQSFKDRGLRDVRAARHPPHDPVAAHPGHRELKRDGRAVKAE